MEFGEQIKRMRAENGMTQEQLANRLHVTRQAVSNWENNRNLPDIEMLIAIAEGFQISLDQLILGGKDMNAMAKKLIHDGSETRRARLNLISAGVGGVLLLVGMLLIAIKGASVEYVDAEGVLHESFFLLPMGFLFLFAGFITFLGAGIRKAVFVLRGKGQRRNGLCVVGICLGAVLLGVGAFLALLEANSGASTALAGGIAAALGVVSIATSVYIGVRGKRS